MPWVGFSFGARAVAGPLIAFSPFAGIVMGNNADNFADPELAS